MKSERQRVAVYSLGCKLNQAEGEAMRHLCGQGGMDLVPFESEADVYVINTCTVTSEADREGRRLARQARRRAPDGAQVVIAGCSAQANTAGMSIPEADLLLGNAEKMRLPEYLSCLPAGGDVSPISGKGASEAGLSEASLPQVRVAAIDRRERMDVFPLDHFEGRTRAFLKVQDGCNFACTFCATTLARGPSRSLDADECVSHARRLAQSGHLEVVMTGIHLGAYGRDLKPRNTLSRLLCHLLEVDEIRRLRLSSVEPGEVTRELIRQSARAAYGTKSEGAYVCRHFHVPVQSGDDEILRAMGRNYTADRCASRFSELVHAMPGVCLGADFIVGFPGESAEAFGRTMEWVRESPISYLHVFSYSEREGTLAASMPGRLKGDEARKRTRALRELGQRKWSAFVASQAGAEAEVLFEGRREDGRLTGLTDNYVRVMAEGPDEWIGELVPMRLEACQGKVGGALVAGREATLVGVEPL
ncbi:MAG: tRNA (N(6)-L-threonylcarbamoyladenosine(37)-C(2))-methylthiotransferase MtaB [Nitrospinaceae bacterium]|nr:tRNA (N(6)-L-threonylcarbamoyladenosine(37)-C(2))-methylthiotransferase MtaB [Nitrospinaceae bacterium]